MTPAMFVLRSRSWKKQRAADRRQRGELRGEDGGDRDPVPGAERVRDEAGHLGEPADDDVGRRLAGQPQPPEGGERDRHEEDAEQAGRQDRPRDRQREARPAGGVQADAEREGGRDAEQCRARVVPRLVRVLVGRPRGHHDAGGDHAERDGRPDAEVLAGRDGEQGGHGSLGRGDRGDDADLAEAEAGVGAGSPPLPRFLIQPARIHRPNRRPPL